MSTETLTIGTFPWELAAHLRKRFGLRAFVETGTSRGTTTLHCAPDFEQVHTIELDLKTHLFAKRRLAALKNVHCYYGQSTNILPLILPQLGAPTLFWLDAHWSGCGMPRLAQECPLLEELRLIGGLRGQDVMLIDDARLFDAAPPAPHKADEWPVLDAIISLVESWPNTHVTIVGDVIVVAPEEIQWPL